MASLKAHHWKGQIYYALERSYREPGSKQVKRKYLVYLGKNPGDPFKKVDPSLEKDLIEARKRRRATMKEAQARALHGPQKKKITSGYRKSSTRKRRSERRFHKRVIHRKRLTGLERQHLRDFVRNSREELRDADVDAYIDSSLEYDENKKILADTFGISEQKEDWELEAQEWEERISRTGPVIEV